MTSINIAEWVQLVFDSKSNLCTKKELEEQARVATKAFIDNDVNYDGSLTLDELVKLCNNLGLAVGNDDEEVLQKIDADGSGCLDLEEWVLWWLKRISSMPNPLKQQEAIARNTFNKYDTDSSGCLDITELTLILNELGANFNENELKDALNELDSDNSGLIELEEFVSWWTDRASNNRKGASLISLKLKKLANKAKQIFYTDIFTSVWKNDIDLVKIFIENESRVVNSIDDSEFGDGWTPLHYACYKGNIEMVQLLLDAKASIKKTNNLGYTPLFYSAQQEHHQISQLLLDKGADPKKTGGEVDLSHCILPRED